MPQQILIYEFVTGGGFLALPGRPLPSGSLADEGASMLQAIASDFVKADLGTTSALRDARIQTRPSVPGCHWIDVNDAGDVVRQLAGANDVVMVIAPECDQHLANVCRLLRPTSRLLLNCDSDFIDWTASKSRTYSKLLRSGIPCATAINLCSAKHSAPPIQDFPVVVKPDDGAGSQGIKVLKRLAEWDDAYCSERWHVERFVPGRAASVAALCGPSHIEWLPPCWQHLAADDNFQLHDVTLIHEPHVQSRAQRLVRQLESVMAGAVGYIGVDIVLGSADDGAGDCVIEINPRLTSSYPLLSRNCRTNLAEELYRIGIGEQRSLAFVKDERGEE